MKIAESLGFFLRYVKNPASIGAVCPSSRFLARKMVAPLKGAVGGDDVVAEFGSGTGAITKYIASELPVKQSNLFCFEFDPVSADVLRAKFPAANIVNDSAEKIADLGDALPRLKCIVSCLPLLSLPSQVVASILQNAENALPKGGLFVQFTYNLAHSPAEPHFKAMKRVCTSFAALNIPPARVDVFRKY